VRRREVELRRVAAAALAGAAVLVTAAPAGAHVTLQPAASRPAELQRYTLYVPNERKVATSGVRVRVPQGVDFALVEPTPGWTAKVVRSGDRISELRWTGGRVGVDQYAELHFIARNPVRAGATAWPALQSYADGKVVRWIGSPDSDEPAPRVSVRESAPVVDAVSTHGQSEPAADGAAPAAAAPKTTVVEKKSGSNALGIVALVVAAGALGVALFRRR
jgi:uncharacterized protein YcnI